MEAPSYGVCSSIRALIARLGPVLILAGLGFVACADNGDGESTASPTATFSIPDQPVTLPSSTSLPGEPTTQIWLVELTATMQALRLAQFPGAFGMEPWLTWSPDGRDLAVPLASVRESGAITMLARNGGEREIALPGISGVARWSPDGSRLAFWVEDKVDRGGTSGLYIVNRDGMGLRQLEAGRFWLVEWAGDDRVVASRNEPELQQLIAFDLSSGQSRELASFHALAAGDLAPKWFTGESNLAPDGNTLAVMVAHRGGACNYRDAASIVLYKLDGSEVREVVARDCGVDAAVWSPDGRSIVYGGGAGLRRIELDSGETEELLSEPAQPWAWLRDGTIIANQRDCEGCPPGYGRVLVVSPTEELTSFDAGYGFSLSPDGRFVAVATDLGISVRSVDDDESQMLVAPEDAWTHSDPIWSPDGGGISFRRVYACSYEPPMEPVCSPARSPGNVPKE